jgi:hypothetical protein
VIAQRGLGDKSYTELANSGFTPAVEKTGVQGKAIESNDVVAQAQPIRSAPPPPSADPFGSNHSRRMSGTIAAIGPGPKGIAVAAKARALAEAGLDAPRVVLIDRNGVAESWSGRRGYTNGRLPLETPPENDEAWDSIVAVRLNIVLPRGLAERLADAADRRDMPSSDLAVELVRRGLAEPRADGAPQALTPSGARMAEARADRRPGRQRLLGRPDPQDRDRRATHPSQRPRQRALRAALHGPAIVAQRDCSEAPAAYAGAAPNSRGSFVMIRHAQALAGDHAGRVVDGPRVSSPPAPTRRGRRASSGP